MPERAAIPTTVEVAAVLKQFRELIESAKKQYTHNTCDEPWQLVLALVDAANAKEEACSLFRETAQQMFLEMEVERDGPDDALEVTQQAESQECNAEGCPNLGLSGTQPKQGA